MRIEIIGNIASGKTTLAHLLAESMEGVFENFQANPFWESFYQAPDVYSFETEITFTLQHYHQIKRELLLKHNFACDFSLALDRSYADVTLEGKKHDIYIQILNELESEVGNPDALVFLSCPEDELMQRIRARGRHSEKSIQKNYLEDMSSSINRNVNQIANKTRVIRINSNKLDFAHDQSSVSEVLDIILTS